MKDGVSKASRKYNKSVYILLVKSIRWSSPQPSKPAHRRIEAELGLKERRYNRRPESLYRIMKKLGFYKNKEVKKKYIPRPYEQMQYPGQRVQIDVKPVPSSCIR